MPLKASAPPTATPFEPVTPPAMASLFVVSVVVRFNVFTCSNVLLSTLAAKSFLPRLTATAPFTAKASRAAVTPAATAYTLPVFSAAIAKSVPIRPELACTTEFVTNAFVLLFNSLYVPAKPTAVLPTLTCPATLISVASESALTVSLSAVRFRTFSTLAFTSFCVVCQLKEPAPPQLLAGTPTPAPIPSAKVPDLACTLAPLAPVTFIRSVFLISAVKSLSISSMEIAAAALPPEEPVLIATPKAPAIILLPLSAFSAFLAFLSSASERFSA